MNYLNIPILTLNSDRFIGAGPLDRATWLCLMRYCAHNETAGVIEGVGTWGDRKLIGLLSVLKEEIHRECRLWEWQGEDIVVWGYPVEQEIACQAKREAGLKYGRGHPKANGKVKDSSANSLAKSSPNSSADSLARRKGKGREGKETTTWLTPFNEIYEPIFQSEIERGKVAPSLKAVKDRVGEEQALAAFRQYCIHLRDKGDLNYFSAARFKATLGQYLKPKAPPLAIHKKMEAQ